MSDARAAIARAMNEEELLETIVGNRKRPGLAPVYGWLVHHSKPARVSGISWTELSPRTWG